MSIATPKKRAANRANAAKSTGPRTPEGKQRASRNAVTHGLFCRMAILPGEDPAQLERLRRGMVARLRPRDELERMLADRAVSEAWRLRRAVAFEGRVIASTTAEAKADRQHYGALYAHKPPLDGGKIIRGLLSEDVLTKLSRYEQRIERSMYRAMAELRRLQAESLPEGEWVDTEAEEADELAAAADDDHPTRETKPHAEYSENNEPPAEEDEEEEDYEDEDEETDEEEDEGARETKPRRENSENDEPAAEEDEEDEDYEDEDEGEEEDEGGPSAAEEAALPRQTKPKAENSEIMLAPPRPEPETPPGPVDPSQELRDRLHRRKPRHPQAPAPEAPPRPVDPSQELRDRLHRRRRR